MMDNAAYHRAVSAKEFMMAMKLPILFLGPYHFRMAPIEMVFNFIKNHDLNPLNTRTTSW
jgi:transposase